jgi:hypothetical protein
MARLTLPGIPQIVLQLGGATVPRQPPAAPPMTS